MYSLGFIAYDIIIVKGILEEPIDTIISRIKELFFDGSYSIKQIIK